MLSGNLRDRVCVSWGKEGACLSLLEAEPAGHGASESRLLLVVLGEGLTTPSCPSSGDAASLASMACKESASFPSTSNNHLHSHPGARAGGVRLPWFPPALPHTGVARATGGAGLLRGLWAHPPHAARLPPGEFPPQRVWARDLKGGGELCRAAGARRESAVPFTLRIRLVCPDASPAWYCLPREAPECPA